LVRRSNRKDPDVLRRQLVELLVNFEQHLAESDLRAQVLELVSANHLLRDMGSSLMGDDHARSASKRIILYLQKHVGEVIHGDEIMVVAGISEYARRVRELRVQGGWVILTGVTVAQIRRNAEDYDREDLADLPKMRTDEYLLQFADPDKEAAHRWHLANDIRKTRNTSVLKKILLFLRENVGTVVSGEELRYVAGNKSEWARRTRELRTDHGWPVATKSNGRPDLLIGTYILERDQQTPPHDRAIKDNVRRAVFMRDHYTCKFEECGWSRKLWNPDDPRHLEVHHIHHYAEGGSNEAENLITYCNICHDVVHRK